MVRPGRKEGGTMRPRHKPTPEELKRAEAQARAWRLLAKAIEQEGRICFGLAWYGTETEAEEAAKAVQEAGHTYNGGYFHGMPCGREKQFDYDHPQAGRRYAVSCR